ncbi:MAG TPA: hypothetical protein VH061_15735 [Solirubrobacteraceae bacterium]|jgi:hypothetical protein|nr:hypothetical protein [Solirubrobacteraceae bacterium]
MKLNELLERFSWRETFEALCQEPPEERSLHLVDARRLIGQQRKSQLAVLSRLMYSPLLEGDYETAKDSSEPRRTASRKLRKPDQASRLFLGSAAQAGKALRPFGPERLSELDRDDAALGRLLLILSVTLSSPKRRGEHAHEWGEIVRQGMESQASSPFGAVLTPMVFSAGFGAGRVEPSASSDLGGPLAVQLHEMTRAGYKLTRWTRSLLNAGAARLRRLRESPEESPDAVLMARLSALKRQGIDDQDIDLWIGLFRDDKEAVEAALDAGADVNVTIDAVLRRYRDRE